MTLGTRTASHREEIAKSARRFGVEIGNLRSMDLIVQSEISISHARGLAADLRGYTGRFVVVKDGVERSLARVEGITEDKDGHLSINVLHLTGSSAGKEVSVNLGQIMQLAYLSKVFRSLERDQKGDDGLNVARGALQLVATASAARITREGDHARIPLKEKLKIIGAKSKRD